MDGDLCAQIFDRAFGIRERHGVACGKRFHVRDDLSLHAGKFRCKTAFERCRPLVADDMTLDHLLIEACVVIHDLAGELFSLFLDRLLELLDAVLKRLARDLQSLLVDLLFGFLVRKFLVDFAYVLNYLLKVGLQETDAREFFAEFDAGDNLDRQKFAHVAFPSCVLLGRRQELRLPSIA